MNLTHAHKITTSLPLLAAAIQQPPRKVVDRAIQENPWFTPYYIQIAIQAVIEWMQAGNIQRFISDYPSPSPDPKRVGIIMAGNIPLVGLHDLLVTLLSGHIAVLKLSHQDQVLMRWVIDTWSRIEPLVDSSIEITRRPEKIAYLLATGSDNSARYFEWMYRGVPKTIRKNRFSIGVLDAKSTVEDIKNLGKDVFLHNGLGCRNVSNILVHPSFDVEYCLDIWRKFDYNQFNQLYLHRLKLLRAKYSLLDISFFEGKYVLGIQQKVIGSSPLGVVRFIDYQDNNELTPMIKSAQEKIQCTVGREIPYGEAQFPQLDDFSDGINIFTILSNI